VHMSVIRHFFHCPEMSVIFVRPIFLANCTAPLLGMKMFVVIVLFLVVLVGSVLGGLVCK
jgi:hypothetical protein